MKRPIEKTLLIGLTLILILILNLTLKLHLVIKIKTKTNYKIIIIYNVFTNIKIIEVKVDWNRMLTDNRALYNKYMLPSYDQFNLDCSYGFEDKLDGLELRLLYVYRRSTDRDIVLSKQHNTVNFNQINVVANFNFAMQRNHHNLSH